MATFRVGERHLGVTEAGAGAPAVLLHSGGLSSRQWGRLIADLSRDHRVIAPDFYGYGESSRITDEAAAGLHDDAAAIAALLASLPEPAHLVGHSYGGLVATRVLLDAPDLVRSVALFEPVAFGVLRSENDAEGLAELARVSRDLEDDAAGGGAAWLNGFVDYWSGPGAFAALPEASRAAWLAVGRKVYLEVRSLMPDPTPLAAYRGVKVPALLLSGERSTLAARRVAKLLASAIPGAKHEELSGATHMAPLFEAGRVNALIGAHVRGARR